MKKIGFIDYYLDEWHANTYPKMIEDATNGEMKVCYAYGKINSPKDGGMTNEQWASKYGVTLVSTIEELIDKSDYLVVLSPDNPEMHEELCDLALKSGKLTYVDKTFAPDKATALRLFEIADKSNTKCYTSSALNFATEYSELDKKDIKYINSFAPGGFEIYAIHQIEPIVKIMGYDAKRIMYVGDETFGSAIIEFGENRLAQFSNFPSGVDYRMNVGYKSGEAKPLNVTSKFFDIFIENMINFFKTEEIAVSHEQTIAVMAIREAALKARKTPFEWLEV